MIKKQLQIQGKQLFLVFRYPFGTYNVPKGYHNGSGRVTQSIPTQGAKTITPNTRDQRVTAGRYLTGDITVKGDGNLVAGNIKSGVSIFGVWGNIESHKYINCNQSGSDSVGSKDTAQVLPSINVTGYNFALIRGRVESAGDLSWGQFKAGNEFCRKCYGYYGSWEGPCAIYLNGQSGNINIGVESWSNSSSMGVSCRLDSIELFYMPGF